MLSCDDQAILTQVGKGTPCGEWLRRFWWPIAVSDSWDGPSTALRLDELVTFQGRTATPGEHAERAAHFTGRPTAVRILGEDLVLYRDLRGEPGLLGLHCPHRGSSLAYGRPREDGLACAYHLWTFNAEGRCLAMPTEAAGSGFPDKVRHLAYPVREMGGLIWAYLGPDEPPILPRIDVVARDDGVRVIESLGIWGCNWLQIVENSVDQIHTGLLHGEGSSRSDIWNEIPTVDWQADEHGIQTFADRGGYRRSAYLRLPTTIQLAQPWPGGQFDWPRYSALWRTPIDDHLTLMLNVTHARALDGHLPDPPEGMEVGIAHRIESVYLQDYHAVVSQGQPADRTVERLGTSDCGIILLRRLIMEGIEAVRRGEDPKGVLREPIMDVILNTAAKVSDGLLRTVEG